MRAEIRVLLLVAFTTVAIALAGCDRREPEGVVPDYVRELEQQGHRVSRPPDIDRHRDVQDDVGRRRWRADPWSGEGITSRSLYVPIRDNLLADVATLHRVLHDCASEKCHMAITSEDQEYLIEQLYQVCRVGLFGPLPSPGAIYLYLYVDESRHAGAREAILPCRQLVVIVDRNSKRTLEVLSLDG
jgi:hypothetical protein